MWFIASIHWVLHVVLFNKLALLTEKLEAGSACALNGEMKGSVESEKNSHMTEGRPN